MRNCTVSACPACGVQISARKELPFLTRRAWRESVAEKLGYEKQFILNLGEKTRIHRHHFREEEIRNNKPVGLPELLLSRVEGWPQANAPVAPVDLNESFEVDVVALEDEQEDKENEKPTCVIVEISQLKLLLRQCHFCGHAINDGSLNCNTKSGIFCASFYCSGCNTKRFWKSHNGPFVQFVTATSMLSRINFAKILQFFTILRCLFPSRSAVYYATQIAIRPIITRFYEFQRHKLFNHFLEIGSPLHLCMDSQYDSHSYSAYHCTVSAIESTTKKILGFKTVKRSKANNKSLNDEPIAFSQLLDEFLTNNLTIASVTTDNSASLNKLFTERYPQIFHFLDLWHILRNMYKKFCPKLNRRHPDLRALFTRMTRYLWKCGSERRHDDDKNIMIEKALSIFFHFVGLHQWPAGRFIDIYNELIGTHNFSQNNVLQDVWMNSYLACKHDENVDEIVADPLSEDFNLLLDDVCSDLRLQQLRRAAQVISTSALESYHSLLLNYKSKRYHFWYLDMRNMIDVLHHNANVDSEARGRRIMEKRSGRIGCTNEIPNDRIHKTIVFNWQKEILDYIKLHAKFRYVVNEEKLVDEFEEVNLNDDLNEDDFDDFLDDIIK